MATRSSSPGKIPPSTRAVRCALPTRLACERILDRADQLGMVVILGYFYVGQDDHLRDEAAVVRATDNATRFLLRHGWRNVMVEINNECDIGFHHAHPASRTGSVS